MKLNSTTFNMDEDFEHIFSMSPSPFAIIHRPEKNPDIVDLFIGDISVCEKLDELPVRDYNSEYEVLVLIPYQQIKERGFEYIDDKTPLISMKIEKHTAQDKTKILEKITDTPIILENEHYSLSDEEYRKTVKKIISDEIGNGAGANFVLKRTYIADIENYSIPKALSIFKKLLSLESGAYWTFIVYTGQRVLVGATPERHISLSDKIATMNPISGTYRYPELGPSVRGMLDFLENKKEIEELYMVVDEELKMMSRICETKATVYGPYIKEMTCLAHTEYLIKGRTSLPPHQILKETLFAPTVTGSPLENACRVIKKYEPEGRGYYSGVIALIGGDRNGTITLDSSIIIRTADIKNDGKFRFSVGSTIVRHSNPELECQETKAKAKGLLTAINNEDISSETITNLKQYEFNDNDIVLKILKQRNNAIWKFWLQESEVSNPHTSTSLIGLNTLIIDAEDTFTSMLYQLLQSLGLNVTVKRFDDYFNIDEYDLIVLGPGPGDPQDNSDMKINQVIVELIRTKSPFLAVCLSHQILCLYLGLKISLKKNPNQGTQKSINLFGSIEKVGFYNSYSGLSPTNSISIKDIGLVEISRDTNSHEIDALRSKNFASMQFHPESVLTQNGMNILKERLLEIIDGNKFSSVS